MNAMSFKEEEEGYGMDGNIKLKGKGLPGRAGKSASKRGRPSYM